MDLLKTYEDFLALKEEITNEALEQASYCEKRETGNVRPFVILKSETHAKQWEEKINKLNSLAKTLIDGDPVRFKPNAKIFNPAPTLYKNVYRVDIRESESASQKKLEKSKIIKRMKNLLEAERHNALSTGDNSKVKQVRSEIEAMENDGEQYYLRRADGYKDIRCLLYLTKECREPVKLSLSFSGVFIQPSDDSPENFLSLPEQSRQLVERNDKLTMSGVTQIKHSLAMRGKLYRYSEYEAMKQRAKQPPAQ